MNRKRILESDSEEEEVVQVKSRKQVDDNDSGNLHAVNLYPTFLDDNNEEQNGAPARVNSSDAESGASDHEQEELKEPVGFRNSSNFMNVFF